LRKIPNRNILSGEQRPLLLNSSDDLSQLLGVPAAAGPCPCAMAHKVNGDMNPFGGPAIPEEDEENFADGASTPETV